MIEALIQNWRAMAQRERTLVALALAVVLVAIGYVALFEPAWAGRRALADEIPALRAQVAQMAALGDEAKQLRGAPRTGDNPQATRAVLESSIGAAGMATALTKLEVSGELIDLRVASVPHVVWLEWLDTTVRETRLRVVDAAITREADPGVVSAKIVFEFPARDAK
ncbi:MAG TPA: type II secretion system protein GspM [Burkholderiaceae bacterium]